MCVSLLVSFGTHNSRNVIETLFIRLCNFFAESVSSKLTCKAETQLPACSLTAAVRIESHQTSNLKTLGSGNFFVLIYSLTEDFEMWKKLHTK